MSIRDTMFANSSARNDSARKRDRRLAELVEAGKAHWVTVKGTHLCIGNASKRIVGGPKKFVGKTLEDAFPGAEVIPDQEPDTETKSKEAEEEEKKAKEEQEKKEKLHQDRIRRGTITGKQIKNIQENNVKLSEKGKNGSCGGFRITAENDYFADHVDSHKDEPPFQNMTDDEYEADAVEFLMLPVGKNIMGGLVSDTVDGVLVTAVIRYDRKTGRFAKGIPGAFVRTYMVPKYTVGPNKEYNPNWKEDGYNYFLKQMGWMRGHEND